MNYGLGYGEKIEKQKVEEVPTASNYTYSTVA